MNVNGAGIDVGASSHFVAVPADCSDRSGRPVREFGAFTADLYRLANQPVTLPGAEKPAQPPTPGGNKPIQDPPATKG